MRSRRILWLVCAVWSGCVAQPRSAAAGVATEGDAAQHVRGSLTALLGRRELEDSLGLAGNHLGVLGLEGEIAPARWPLGLELGLGYAAGSDHSEFSFAASDLADSFDCSMFEFYLGPRLTYDAGLGGVYVGGGPVWADAEGETGTISLFGSRKQSQSDSTEGLYVHAGVFVHGGSNLAALLEARWTFQQTVELFSEQDRLDYWQINVGWALRF